MPTRGSEATRAKTRYFFLMYFVLSLCFMKSKHTQITVMRVYKLICILFV